jgi:hypothetical protein
LVKEKAVFVSLLLNNIFVLQNAIILNIKFNPVFIDVIKLKHVKVEQISSNGLWVIQFSNSQQVPVDLC